MRGVGTRLRGPTSQTQFLLQSGVKRDESSGFHADPNHAWMAQRAEGADGGEA